jgi:hypothetical protein
MPRNGKKIFSFTIIAPALQLSQQLNSLYLLSNIESILSAFFCVAAIALTD